MFTGKSRIVAAVSAGSIAVTATAVMLLGGGAATAAGPSAPAAGLPNTKGAVTGYHVKDGSLYCADLGAGMCSWFTGGPYDNTVGSATVRDDSLQENDLAPALRDKLNAEPPAGPAYLKHWGTISRNVIGAADADLATTSTEAPSGAGALHLHTASSADKVAFGNEVDFQGKKLSELGTFGYTVYTTRENTVLGDNMPSIAIEIDPNVKGVDADYSSLVYAPANSKAGEWTEIDSAKGDGKYWGLTGGKFNGTQCSINGERCTWSEVRAYLGDETTVYTVGISKGRDYAGSWDVDNFRIGGTTYDFEPNGVLATK